MSAADTEPTGSEQDTAGSKRRGGQAGLIAALIVVALIAVGAVAAVAVRHASPHRAASGVAGTTPDAGGRDSTATGFAVPVTDVFGRRVNVPRNPAGQPLPQTAPQHSPADPGWLTAAPVLPQQGGWQQVAGASVPFSISDGPTRLTDGVAAGWSHTPQGAALAGVYAAYQLNARPGDRAVHTRLLENAPGALSAFDADKAAGRIPTLLPQNVTRYLVAPDAFRVDSYADDMAVLEIATRTADEDGTPAWTATQIVMVWDGGDWRLQPPPGATPPQHVESSLTGGWTAW
ncbi:hypothetical protein [Nocardia alni]|uniref:hypothetical protein n=1 Tax=Nocardia alni TaxID=2815723 RepID=UPI001C21C16D|nr:hypothetical protein [Nocardia alni]